MADPSVRHTNHADVKDIGYGELCPKKLLTTVLNYDFPTNTEDYIHQIGRTGRAGRKGVAITFFTSENNKSARELVGILREAFTSATRELRRHAAIRPCGRTAPTDLSDEQRGRRVARKCRLLPLRKPAGRF